MCNSIFILKTLCDLFIKVLSEYISFFSLTHFEDRPRQTKAIQQTETSARPWALQGLLFSPTCVESSGKMLLCIRSDVLHFCQWWVLFSLTIHTAKVADLLYNRVQMQHECNVCFSHNVLSNSVNNKRGLSSEETTSSSYPLILPTGMRKRHLHIFFINLNLMLNKAATHTCMNEDWCQSANTSVTLVFFLSLYFMLDLIYAAHLSHCKSLWWHVTS